MMQPLLTYYGGKQRIASRIAKICDSIDHNAYLEPFAGGAAVFFARTPPTRYDYLESLNDRDRRIVTVYRVAREQPEEFARWVQCTAYAKEEHRRSREILKNWESHSELEQAWAVYVSLSQSFSSKLGDAWARNKTTTTRQSRGKDWCNRIARLPECLERLQRAVISCEDALEYIEHHDSKHALFYIDPPYPETNQGHYGGYTMQDWEALCSLLDRIEGSYILSNYPQAIEPRNWTDRIDIQTKMSASSSSNDTERTERLWVCDRNPRKVVQPNLFEDCVKFF